MPSPPKPSQSSRPVEFSSALRACRGAFVGIGLISAVLNVLLLTGAFFMLGVYDRVLPSRSLPTLVALALLAFGLYLFQAILDVLRGRVLPVHLQALARSPTARHGTRNPTRCSTTCISSGPGSTRHGR